MVPTLKIFGSEEALAPIGNSILTRGQRRNIIVIAYGDGDLPEVIAEAFKGLQVSTIFSSEQLNGATPPGSRTAYAEDVAEALVAAGKPDMAALLMGVVKKNDPTGEYHFIVFKHADYRLVESVGGVA
ncbi:MAG: hypothetical protein Q7S95_02180 [bacterium]|nr:hypothetical protein [bacterium]